MKAVISPYVGVAASNQAQGSIGAEFHIPVQVIPFHDLPGLKFIEANLDFSFGVDASKGNNKSQFTIPDPNFDFQQAVLHNLDLRFRFNENVYGGFGTFKPLRMGSSQTVSTLFPEDSGHLNITSSYPATFEFGLELPGVKKDGTREEGLGSGKDQFFNWRFSFSGAQADFAKFGGPSPTGVELSDGDNGQDSFLEFSKKNFTFATSLETGREKAWDVTLQGFWRRQDTTDYFLPYLKLGFQPADPVKLMFDFATRHSSEQSLDALGTGMRLVWDFLKNDDVRGYLSPSLRFFRTFNGIRQKGVAPEDLPPIIVGNEMEVPMMEWPDQILGDRNEYVLGTELGFTSAQLPETLGGSEDQTGFFWGAKTFLLTRAGREPQYISEHPAADETPDSWKRVGFASSLNYGGFIFAGYTFPLQFE